MRGDIAHVEALRDTVGRSIPGVRCVGAVGASARAVGDIVSVRGSISLWKSGSDHYALVRVAQPGDITQYAP